jgi:hypothetical protein
MNTNFKRRSSTATGKTNQNPKQQPHPVSPEDQQELKRLQNLVAVHYHYWQKHGRASSELKYLTHKRQLEKQFGVTHTPFQPKPRNHVVGPVALPPDGWFDWEIEPTYTPHPKFT